MVSRRLKDDFDNGRTYYELHGHPLHLPANPAHRPDQQALAWHRERCFLG